MQDLVAASVRADKRKKPGFLRGILVAVGVWAGKVGGDEQEQPQTVDRALEEFGVKA